jgi:hypothetical protein
MRPQFDGCRSATQDEQPTINADMCPDDHVGLSKELQLLRVMSARGGGIVRYYSPALQLYFGGRYTLCSTHRSSSQRRRHVNGLVSLRCLLALAWHVLAPESWPTTHVDSPISGLHRSTLAGHRVEVDVAAEKNSTRQVQIVRELSN